MRKKITAVMLLGAVLATSGCATTTMSQPATHAIALSAGHREIQLEPLRSERHVFDALTDLRFVLEMLDVEKHITIAEIEQSVESSLDLPRVLERIEFSIKLAEQRISNLSNH